MQYAPSDLKPRERYKVLTSFVLPRPIAWVTTMGATGVVNAAPFSFFNVFCEDPPLCMFAANLRPDGRVKDTVINIRRTGEFVVNMTDEALALAMHESSGDFPPDIGEPDYLNLKLAPSTKIAVPQLADAPFAMECRTWKEIDVNGDRLLIMGEGIHFHIRDELWDHAAMRVHMDRYHPIGVACLRTVIAAPMIAWCFRRPRERRRPFRRRMGGAKRYPSASRTVSMGIASLHPSYGLWHRPVRAQEGADLAHRERHPLFRLLPRKQADFSVRRQQRAFHGDRVRMRGDVIGQDQDRRPALANEIARHGEDEIRIGAIHPRQEFLGHLHR